MDGDVTKVPKYGFKVKLDHIFPERWTQGATPKIRQIIQMLGLIIRYLLYYFRIVRKGRLPLMDCLYMKTGLQMYGVPIGGIGAGSIGRGFRGEFCRYALKPGIYEYETMMANQFIVTVAKPDGTVVYNQVLSTNKKPKVLSRWKWGFAGDRANYTALYPRSWTEYDIEELEIKLICRQISPVIPHNYKDSSLPCAVFVWDIVNNSKNDFQVSITFTFQSGTGSKSDMNGEKWNEYFECEGNVSGVMIHQELHDMACTYAISSISRNDVNITRMLFFDPTGDGESLWSNLQNKACLLETEQKISTKSKKASAAAVCTTKLVRSTEKTCMEFCLAWDMPKINFFYNEEKYLRYYTKFFPRIDGVSAAPDIARYALTRYNVWERDIFHWQSTVLNDENLPDWYKSALFNELYFVSDGGTVWIRADENSQYSQADPRKEFGRFAYLEGHEYRMYNTYDVHFYASSALIQLWPNLQASLQYDYRDTINEEDKTIWTTLYDGQRHQRKVKGTIPHDVGDPDEEPFKLINSYPIHDVSEWKDLNTKFILCCYRDYTVNKNVDQLKDLWPSIRELVEYSLKWDQDQDGLIENGNFPDQTYDIWVMSGPSAYCGSLWLAALHCASKIATILEQPDEAKKYNEILRKGKVAFQEKLWNGRYYNFDHSQSSYCESIMSDQLCGQWMMRACGFRYEVFPQDRVRSSLETIFQNNVMKYKNGNQGAVNGFMPSGTIDTTAIQSEEMWVGVNYSLAAHMIYEGMIKEGFRTAEGAYRTVYEKIGMGFETPEALYENKHYRSIGYMRPLSIWAMQQAWIESQPNR